MTFEELELRVAVLQNVINKINHRIVVLENRLEELDKIKMKRPTMHKDDNGFPIA
jgi:hypothetical protein